MKNSRHDAILKIITEKAITTQQELASELNALGYDVTQTTVSRDIKMLGLTKKHDRELGMIYVRPKKPVKINSEETGKMMPVFYNAFISAEDAGNLVLVKTLSGMAQAVAASIDSMTLEGFVGCVAGDDSILLVFKEPAEAVSVADELNKLVRDNLRDRKA